ncbi:MAG: glycosyltransferase [Candidatus Aminicenantes bacterium]|nr:MAG: glycosyltransferase [Candidatus Aminicenantes bacterium]
MKILIIAYYYPPISTGGTLRPVHWAKYLPQFGHEITILTHTYDKTKTKPGIIRIHDPSFNKSRTNLRKKCQWLILRLFTETLNILGFYHSIYTRWKQKVIKNSQKIIQQVQPDIIIATYPPIETLEIGVYISKKYNIPLISDFRDGLMFEPIETKRMKQYRCIRERYKEIEKQAAAHSAAITSIAQPITDYYKETYHPPHAEVISNAFDPEDLKDIPGDIRFDHSFFNIVFTGRFTLSDKYNRVDFFFDAVRLLIRKEKDLEKKIKIHLVGEYRKEELQDLKDLIDKEIIVLHGFVERSKSLAYQRAADLLLIITLPDRRSSTSAKIFEYLYAGKPILALTHQTVLEDIINETKTGWNVHPQQPKAIADLLQKIIIDTGFYHSIKPDGEKIEQYSIKSQMEKLNHLLEKIECSNV